MRFFWLKVSKASTVSIGFGLGGLRSLAVRGLFSLGAQFLGLRVFCESFQLEHKEIVLLVQTTIFDFFFKMCRGPVEITSFAGIQTFSSQAEVVRSPPRTLEKSSGTYITSLVNKNKNHPQTVQVYTVDHHHHHNPHHHPHHQHQHQSVV